MKLHSLLAGFVVAAALLNLDQTFGGPTYIRDYRFSPPHSTLTVDRPWLEAPTVQLRVTGTFSLEFGPGSGDPWLGQTAQFVNVDAWAFNPLTAAAPLDLDEALNLSDLKGIQLPVASLFDVYKFDGKNAEGSAVTLFARVLGPLLQLDGGTSSPDGENRVVYDLMAQAWQLPFADFNDDDRIDHADLLTWESGFSAASLDGFTPGPLGDADGDDDVDGADFLVWQRQLGSTPTAAVTAAVPEPTALVMLVTGMLAINCRRRMAVS